MPAGATTIHTETKKSFKPEKWTSSEALEEDYSLEDSYDQEVLDKHQAASRDQHGQPINSLLLNSKLLLKKLAALVERNENGLGESSGSRSSDRNAESSVKSEGSRSTPSGLWSPARSTESPQEEIHTQPIQPISMLNLETYDIPEHSQESDSDHSAHSRVILPVSSVIEIVSEKPGTLECIEATPVVEKVEHADEESTKQNKESRAPPSGMRSKGKQSDPMLNEIIRNSLTEGSFTSLLRMRSLTNQHIDD